MDTSFLYENSIGRLVQQTSTILNRNIHKQLEVCGITVEQFGVINSLHKDNGTTLCNLANKINKDHTNVSRIITKLEAKGWVRRHTPAHDKRASMLFLTEAGEQIREQGASIAEKTIEQELRGISIEEQALLRKLLVRLCTNVQPT